MEAIQKGIDDGYKRTKLKFAKGWGLEMLKPVRANFPQHTFHIDCNSSFTLDDLPMFKEVDKLGLAMIEQPLPYDDLIEHAKLQGQMQTPICLDESIKSVRDLRLAIELKSCRYVNIKHGRVGGLQSSLDIHNLARDNGIPAWIGGMLESSLAVGISVELATLENIVYPSDVGASSQFIKEDITEPTIEFPGKERILKPSSVPGVPYLPDPKKLAKHTREKFILEGK
jgi:O-succinylbenzoate synthase